ncbi:MAG: glutamate synthase (NADPH), homotetrameric [Candidatus Margulisiibacteriota bacterium]|nr:MAG: glutamate synthase (NADPH), homotetrameric [Candidatus Margulisbacteria bacterium GWD2_39_127]OGI05587.1 MAG: glutamate synthase (NADPH), homotetrameric [Candidatus Margulisbacteria bacterium GWF2_38_17]OGI07544.1 MAG: glutamate synthase (NADPH), homotetrameric [Candidatus Margulisbacteria bacterium GWE2_39_32]PZM84887.1 MAG: glutamate synthase (NADPH), homotetrameric [Candidatus Margulisiibacteriota bacterium]HAR64027.1 glutamate synthase (NADPH), homotetrameric [Candidatus Margulisiib
MSVKKNSVPMREQSPELRVTNFEEVPLGYSIEEAIKEASRCLQCATRPCVSGCPVCINIPDFIKELRNENFQKAIDIIHKSNSLPAVTGRVCPQEKQCQSVCVMKKAGEPVSIGRLERFLADWDLNNRKTMTIPVINKKIVKTYDRTALHRVAIVGSGPAGLSCAVDLAKMDYEVTVFEGFHEVGGVLVYGIPEFRLPKVIVSKEINQLKDLGVIFATNILIGKALTLEELFQEGFSAIFIGTGAGLPNFMGIPGENLNGIYSANEFLTRVNLMKAYKFPDFDTPIKRGKKVAVIGAGNVAMDCARTALRLGAEQVHLIYRRTEEEMPARTEEIHHAREEGIQFHLLTNPVAYTGDEAGFVTQVMCEKMILGDLDASGRKRPTPKSGSEYSLSIDEAIIAVGTTPHPIIARTTPGLKTKKRGEIEVDDQGMTSIPGIFAGGDIVTGAATVITAMGAGKKAAIQIDSYIKN